MRSVVVQILIYWFVFPFVIYGSFEGSVTIETQAFNRGEEIGKKSLSTFFEGVIQRENMGLYGSLEGHVPLEEKNIFQDRWIVSGGFLKKLTPHFTFDFGIRYVWLQRDKVLRTHQWLEEYIGVRSNLLMSPKMYLFMDTEHQQWCVEYSFGYDFDLSVFEWKGWKLSWNNKFGFLKAKRPYGNSGNRLNRKHHYKYIETNFFLKKEFKKWGSLYFGPTFVYNTGGTQPWTVVNSAIYRSHFCGLSVGLEFEF